MFLLRAIHAPLQGSCGGEFMSWRSLARAGTQYVQSVAGVLYPAQGKRSKPAVLWDAAGMNGCGSRSAFLLSHLDGIMLNKRDILKISMRTSP